MNEEGGIGGYFVRPHVHFRAQRHHLPGWTPGGCFRALPLGNHLLAENSVRCAAVLCRHSCWFACCCVLFAKVRDFLLTRAAKAVIKGTMESWLVVGGRTVLPDRVPLKWTPCRRPSVKEAGTRCCPHFHLRFWLFVCDKRLAFMRYSLWIIFNSEFQTKHYKASKSVHTAPWKFR